MFQFWKTLFCVADVPDAPRNVALSDFGDPRNVTLSWIPGNDHNSSVAGESYFMRQKNYET